MIELISDSEEEEGSVVEVSGAALAHQVCYFFFFFERYSLTIQQFQQPVQVLSSHWSQNGVPQPPTPRGSAPSQHAATSV